MSRIGKNDHVLPARVEESFSERPSNLGGGLESLDDVSELSQLDRNSVPLEAAPTKKKKNKAPWDFVCGGNCFRHKRGHVEIQKFDATAAV